MADYKDPKDRTHMWERPARSDEQTVGAAFADYEHDLPRWLHKEGVEEPLLVSTPDECDAAKADGYQLHRQFEAPVFDPPIFDPPVADPPVAAKKGKQK